MRTKARIITALVALVVLPLADSNAVGADRDPFCAVVKTQSGASGEFFVRTSENGAKPLRNFSLGEIRGQRLSLYYGIRRSAQDYPNDVALLGALNVKTEILEPDPKSRVALFNNRIPKGCPSTSFDTYQAFHSRPVIDACQRHGFHNGHGLLPTAEPFNRREAFLFPVGPDASFKNIIERFFSPNSAQPATRASQIYNFTASTTVGATCIPFFLTVPRDANGLSVMGDDFLENIYHQRPSRVRVELK